MNRDSQLELIDRIQAHRKQGRGTDTAASLWHRSTAAYTSADRLTAERRLMTQIPTVVGLSALLPGPATYASVTVGNAPVVLTRDRDGELFGMLNVCRHRGAQVTTGCGATAMLSCPYHGWSYQLDGSLSARRRPEYFDELSEEGLIQLPVLEQHGLLWVSGTPGAAIPDQPLAGAEVDIAQLALANHRLFTSTTFTRPINWKLVIDTFLEGYHIPVLHRATIEPLIHGDFALFDAYGPHARMIVTRKTIVELDNRPREQWSLLPHTTLVWALQPNAVLIYQQDHAQLYQAHPGAHPGESIITVSIYVPENTTRDDSHWQRNFDLLVEVTDTEDFVTCAGIQRGFEAEAQDHITFGRNEPALAHYDRSLDELLEEV